MFSEVFFSWTGREAGGGGCNFVQIEIGSLILSFIALRSCIATLGALLYFELLSYKCGFFLFHGFIPAEA